MISKTSLILIILLFLLIAAFLVAYPYFINHDYGAYANVAIV